MTLSFVILSLELTLFNKNFDHIIKYNGSKVTLIKNYIYTQSQCDARNINGYELTVENSFPCSQRTCLRQISILQVAYVLYVLYVLYITLILHLLSKSYF